MKNIVLRTTLCVLISLFAFPLSRLCLSRQIDKPSPEVWQRFLSFENRDLPGLDKKNHEEFTSLLKEITRGLPKPDFEVELFPPYYLWNLSGPGGSTKYVLFTARGLFSIPGDSRAKTYVFDADGLLVSHEEFSLGWRAQFNGVKLITEPDLNVPLIKVSTSGSNQYYALIGDHLALLRLEGEGKTIRNKFVASNWVIGPSAPNRTATEWEQGLLSSNPLEILRTLGWIGGKHWDLKIPPFELRNGYITPTPDVRENAELVVSVRARDAVRRRLKELSKSKNQWISEAAELALKPHDGDTSFCCGYASQ